MKACFVIPYFGKFPNYFDYFLSSAIYNKDYDFLFVTDIDYAFPNAKNIKVAKMTFKEVQDKAKLLFNFDSCLKEPYKLCDYKPAYGMLFEEYLKDYDYWGHCDIDTVLGDLNKFIPQDNKYLRIFCEGHMSLYKNCKEVNNWFRTLSHPDCQIYRDVYSTDDIRCFDEWGAHKGNGISYIIQKNGIEQYEDSKCFDVNSLKYKFVNAKDKSMHNGYFEYVSGKVLFWKYENGVYKDYEVSYVHFQKRKMKIEGSNIEHFYVVQPNVIKDEIHLDKPLKRMYSIQWGIYDQEVKRKFRNIKNRLKKL